MHEIADSTANTPQSSALAGDSALPLGHCRERRNIVHNLSPKVVAIEGSFQHQAIHTRGIRLHAVTAGDSSGPAVVLLHDWQSCWVDFLPTLPLLGNLGLHAIALDIRGYGMSDKPPTGHDLRHLTGDIAGAIRTLGHDRAHVVGMGTGATLAWTLGTSHPDHVASISSMGAIHPTDMRKAVYTRPWLFASMVITILATRLPTFLLRPVWRQRKRLLHRNLKRTTTPAFQRSPAFTDALTLREKTLAIANTQTAAIRTARLPIAIAPIKWATTKVTVPTHLLIDDSKQAARLLHFSQSRSLLGTATSQVPNSSQQPHLENPEGFTTIVGNFVRSVENPHS